MIETQDLVRNNVLIYLLAAIAAEPEGKRRSLAEAINSDEPSIKVERDDTEVTLFVGTQRIVTTSIHEFTRLTDPSRVADLLLPDDGHGLDADLVRSVLVGLSSGDQAQRDGASSNGTGGGNEHG